MRLARAHRSPTPTQLRPFTELRVHSNAVRTANSSPSDALAATGHSRPSVDLDIFIYDHLSPVLGQFCLLRRQINFERYNALHGKDIKCEVRVKRASTALRCHTRACRCASRRARSTIG